jgi:hypothetical protein
MIMPRLRLHLIGLLGALTVTPAVFAQSTACQTVQFGDEVLARFPNVRAECLDIIERNGQKFAVFKGDLVRTGRNLLYVRFKRPNGTHGSTRKINTDPARRVLIEGKPYRVDNLAVGQELTAYVKVSEPVIALAPPAEEPLDLQPLEAEAPPPPAVVASTVTMPHTASPLYVWLLTGSLMLLFGMAIGFARRRLFRS